MRPPRWHTALPLFDAASVLVEVHRLESCMIFKDGFYIMNEIPALVCTGSDSPASASGLVCL